MRKRYTSWFWPILIIFGIAVWISSPKAGLHYTLNDRSVDWDIKVHQGLDLQGGLQVLLEADVPAEQEITDDAMSATRTIVDQRVNALGVAEPIVQRQGERRLSVELPGIDNPEQAVALLKETALMEFVDVGSNPMAPGTRVRTDFTTGEISNFSEMTSKAKDGESVSVEEIIFSTIMTGADLESANVGRDPVTSEYIIGFTLSDRGADIFGDYTSKNVGSYLAIVLDGRVISAPVIRDAITNGQGQISGNFTSESANQLALQLRYGALPVPLTVLNSRTVGPTLGQDSVRLSLMAGIIGFSAVALFMLLYYRMPGAIAVLTLAMYSAITFALFKLIPVTLTLPGIAGFVLSVGVAVDANILIFERLKEELRAGRRLTIAVDEGFRRAWPSIRDSNISTLITCTILFWFGNTFGASIVKGFALTLAIGVGVSLFTAILATRTLMHVFLDRVDFEQRKGLFGI